jgi:hypothetical protein
VTPPPPPENVLDELGTPSEVPPGADPMLNDTSPLVNSTDEPPPVDTIQPIGEPPPENGL